jgi:hypothetical protein
MTTELRGEAREVAREEVQAVLAHAAGERRAAFAALAAEVDGGAVEACEELLESVLELGLQSGRVRAHYGPGGEQAALATLRRLPRGRARTDSANAVSQALQALNGKQLDGVRIHAVAPGAFTVSIEADGLEASVRLDGNGARLTSVAT